MARDKKSGNPPEPPASGDSSATSRRPGAKKNVKSVTPQSAPVAQAETALQSREHFSGTATNAAITASAHQAAGGNGNSQRQISDEEIRRRAYENYQRRGGQGGSDWDDWFRAERELKSRTS